MTRLMFAAALAATVLAAPAAAAAATPPTSHASATEGAGRIHELAHIRTALHGDTGPLVVLIPGMSTPGAVWDSAVAELRRDHRLLVVEVKGFEGASAPANARPGLLDSIVAELASDLEARGESAALVAGHSMGGLLALKLGLASPASARSLLVIDALPFFGTVFDGAATVDTIRPRAEKMRDMMNAQADKIRAMAAAMKDKPLASDPGRGMVIDRAGAEKVARWSLAADPAVVAEAVYEDTLTDLRTDIARIGVPVTVLYQAELDPAAAKARYETDYRALPSARLVPVTRTSHFIMLDRPELVIAEIRSLARP